MRVLGHRGQMCIDGPPENTAAAVHQAFAAGAHGVEVDVRITADAVPVCLHDRDLQRMAGRSEQVADLPWRALRDVMLPGGHKVPTLAEVAALSRGRGRLVLDVKHDAGSPGTLAAAVVSVLQRQHAGATVIVSSHSEALLDAVRVLDPRLRRALITGRNVPMLAGWQRVLGRGHHDLHPHLAAVFADHTAVERAISAGMVLRCWTVNRPVDARLVGLLGIAEIITDDPGSLRNALTESAARHPA